MNIKKTHLIQEFAKEKGVKLVEMITSQMSPFEISGIGMPDKDLQQMIYYNYDKLDTLEDGDIIFFDELTNGNPTVLNACLTVIEQRRLISGKPLPNVMIIAAGNYEGMSPMTPQIKRRFEWIDVKFDASMWQKFMSKTYGMPDVISRKLCNLIKNETFEGYNFNTPADHDKAVDTIIHNVYSSYNNELTPILDTLIENTKDERVKLAEGVFLEPNEKISWLKLKRYELGLVVAEEVEDDSRFDDYLFTIKVKKFNPDTVCNAADELQRLCLKYDLNEPFDGVGLTALKVANVPLKIAHECERYLKDRLINVELLKQ